MKELRQLLHCKYLIVKSKGFVLTVDAIIALLLVVAFITVVRVSPYEPQPYLSKVLSTQKMGDIFAEMDENGFMLEALDANATADAKMNQIYGKLRTLIPKNMDFRIELLQYNPNILNCRALKTFDSCFTLNNIYPAKGGALPLGRDLTSGTTSFMKKQPPGQCELVGAGLAGKKGGNSGSDKLLLSDYKGTLFFDGERDINVFFGVKINPEGEIECDQQVTVDINVFVPPDENIGERKPADIMLVVDRSGSMDEYTIRLADLNSGTFNQGTYSTGWGGSCSNFGNWKTIGTFSITETRDFQVSMENYNYQGACRLNGAPFLRLRNPNNQILGGSSDTVTVSGAQVIQGTWKAEGWSDYSIYYDLVKWGQKLDSMKVAASEFVNYAEWHTPLDQLGLVSYNQVATLNQQLLAASDPNKQIIVGKINGLTSTGNTATGYAMNTATTELLSVRGNPNAMQFQVLLSDGKTNTCGCSCTDPNCSGSTTYQAHRAADNNVAIFTIGFGEDADQADLQNIANITGGSYHYAADENSLKDVYEIIKLEIGGMLVEGDPSRVYDSNLMIPVLPGTRIDDPGAGDLIKVGDDNILYYYIGFVDKHHPWTGTYKVTFPCNENANCETDWKIFPEWGTYFHYEDENGNFKPPLLFDSNKTVTFKYRDLTVDIFGGEVRAENEIYLDANAINRGYLSSGATTVEFYFDDPYTGQFITSRNVSAKCGAKTPGCINYFEVFNEVPINDEGYIFAIINKDGTIKECPGNNIAEIYCYTNAHTQYFILKYWLWYK